MILTHTRRICYVTYDLHISVSEQTVARCKGILGILDSTLCIPDSLSVELGFRILSLVGFQIPQAKISRIPLHGAKTETQG